MALQGPDQRPAYTPSYIPASASPTQEQRFEEICFDVPAATYDYALNAAARVTEEERWMTIRDTSYATIELCAKLALFEAKGSDPSDISNHVPLLTNRESQKDRLAPLFGDVRITWKYGADGMSNPERWYNIIFEARRILTRRKLAGILPIGRRRPMVRVTGYTSFEEPLANDGDSSDD